MKVAILGAGPAGLMAAHGVAEYGHDPYLFDADPEVLTRLRAGDYNAGVFLQHTTCNLSPLQGTGRLVSYDIYGRGVEVADLSQRYREKVYGDRLKDGEDVSISIYGGRHVTEWDGHAGVGVLLDMFEERVDGGEHLQFTHDNVETFLELFSQYERLIVTLPLPKLWLTHPMDEDNWPHVKVGVYNSVAPEGESYVWYNPQAYPRWYRAAAAFGRFTLEYPADAWNGRTIIKPIRPPAGVAEWMSVLQAGGNVLFAGRFAEWRKGVEQHHVYERVTGWLSQTNT